MGKIEGKNEQKMRKLTKDIFCQVKICCLHTQLLISITGPGYRLLEEQDNTLP